MRQIFLALIFSMLVSLSFAQNAYYGISGVVVNAESKVPLQGASVYAENTTLGTTSDQDGRFFLQLPNGGYNLVISYTGYNTQNLRVANSSTDPLHIEMSLKDKAMQEVAIVSTNEVKNGWEKYGSFFTSDFIGQTANSKACTIKNPEVLKFYFSKRKNRLKVLATEPLMIDNSSLGYTIKYELDSFVHEYNSSMTVYTGNPLFQEMKSDDTLQIQKWHDARIKAYYGSLLHFMRSVYAKSLDEESFEIKFVVKINGLDSALKVDDFYEALRYKKDETNSTVLIEPKEPVVGVLYNAETPEQAYLLENKESPSEFQFSSIACKPGTTVRIEKNGFYYEQNDILISEYWEWNKMADMLPFDYWPE